MNDWKKISEYCIEHREGRYRISMQYCNGVQNFTLWVYEKWRAFDWEPVGNYGEASRAKQSATKRINGDAA